MTATDELCRMLDERGVEHVDEKDGKYLLVTWSYNETSATFVEDTVSGETSIAISDIVSPEQAIAATLGRDDTYTREDVEDAFVSGYSLGSLPVGSDPRWDENRQTVDEHMAELGWVRASDTEGASTDTDGHDSGHVRNVSATLGTTDAKPTQAESSGTCRNVAVPDEYSDRPFTCSECGARGPMGNGTYHLASSWAMEDGTLAFADSWPVWKYCPNCGAKVVSDG